MAYVNIPASTGNISVNVPSSQGRIDISTASKNDTTNVSLQDVQSFMVNKAKDWAEKMDGPIGSEGYSAKWHATEASKSTTEAQEYAELAENSKDELLNDTGFIAVKDNLNSIITTAVNIEDINTNAENIEAIKDTAGLLEHIEKKSMPVGTIFQAIRTDIPEGSLRLDGTEFTTGFEGFVTKYLATGKIISKSLEEWQTEYTMTNGNVGFFGYDEATSKFKTPCIQAGTFLAQAVTSGQFGSFLASSLKSHTHSWSGTTSSNGAHTHTRGTMNITGTFTTSDSGTYTGAFYKNGTAASKSGSSGDVDDNVHFDASKSWTGATSSNGAHTHTVSGTNGATGGSDTYPKHIRYPFFVVVSNVVAEEPSQATWDSFVGNLDGKANKSLNNLDEQGEKHFLNKSQITNCLLEVPQNIKLELNNGVLTLKAGSKVVVPNGFEADGTTPKFDYLTIESDVTYSIAFTSSVSCYALYHPVSKQFMIISLGDPNISYDKTVNKVTHTNVSGLISFPIALVVRDTTGIGSIDQVFNGMGYFGSTIWVDKGVKGLVPNGRNEDGSLRNIEFTVSKVVTTTLSGTANTMFSLASTGTIYVRNVDYDTKNNLNLSNGTNFPVCVSGEVSVANGVITSFQPKLPVHLANKDDINTLQENINTVEENSLNKQQITNCITEIPQDIKLELNNGTLTLKAGSKALVPNGVGVFDEVVIESDLTHTTTANGVLMLVATKSNLSPFYVSKCFSGSTAPTVSGSGYLWYDTTNNKLKVFNGTTWNERGDSLPIAIVTANGTSYSFINQVFNGLGYIGNTAWVDKGVKVLIPCGRNEDGSLKNTEHTLDKVCVVTNGAAVVNGKFVLTPNSISQGSAYLVDGNTYSYQENEPTTIRWYKPSTNMFYLKRNGVWGEDRQVLIGSLSKTTTSFTSFQPKLPFRAVDYSGKSEISGWAMPSSKYIDLTLGASGTYYTAPANGWLVFGKRVGATTAQYILLINKTANMRIVDTIKGDKGNELGAYLPVRKGDSVFIEYNATGETTSFKFHYAEGEV